MHLRNQVEWALHCCTLLAGLPPDRHLSTKALAEFHGVPKEYLSKALQGLTRAGIVAGTLGPSGGYRLAKPPQEITFLDVVEAVEGAGKTFVCSEIRRNNPCLPKAADLPRPCAIARVMWDADRRWRAALRETRISDMIATLATELDPDLLRENAEWIEERS